MLSRIYILITILLTLAIVAVIGYESRKNDKIIHKSRESAKPQRSTYVPDESAKPQRSTYVPDESAKPQRSTYVSETGIENNPVFIRMAKESATGYYLRVLQNPIAFVSEVGDPRLNSLEETEKLFVFHYRRMWRNNRGNFQQYSYDNSAGDFLAKLLRQKFGVSETRIGELCDIAE